MNATLSRLARDLVVLRAQVAPPAAALSPIEVFTRAVGHPDPWQAGVLTSEAGSIILLASRQSGKSETAAALATHRAVTVPGSLVLLLAPALRQSQELFRKVRACYAALDDVVPTVVENALSLEFGNRSRICCLPGSEKTIRGFSAPALVVEDEAARVPDALHQAARAMLAVSRGRLVLLSSAFGARGHFYQTWERAGPEWLKVKITAHEVPRIAPEWLAAERASIGDWWWRQEYMCEFLQADDCYFDADAISRAFIPGVGTLFPLGVISDVA